MVGPAFQAYYARMAGARVSAQIQDSKEFWSLGETEFDGLKEALAGIGVKAIVATNRPENCTAGAWKDVNVTGPDRYSILFLRTAPGNEHLAGAARTHD